MPILTHHININFHKTHYNHSFIHRSIVLFFVITCSAVSGRSVSVLWTRDQYCCAHDLWERSTRAKFGQGHFEQPLEGLTANLWICSCSDSKTLQCMRSEKEIDQNVFRFICYKGAYKGGGLNYWKLLLNFWNPQKRRIRGMCGNFHVLVRYNVNFTFVFPFKKNE